MWLFAVTSFVEDPFSDAGVPIVTVTLPEVPPPVRPLPAVTAVMSPTVVE